MLQPFGVFSLLLSLLLVLPATYAQIQAPLSDYHPGCNSVNLSRDPACMAAFHRYCQDNNYGIAGYPQELGVAEIGFLCAKTIFFGNVAYGMFFTGSLKRSLYLPDYSLGGFPLSSSLFSYLLQLLLLCMQPQLIPLSRRSSQLLRRNSIRALLLFSSSFLH